VTLANTIAAAPRVLTRRQTFGDTGVWLRRAVMVALLLVWEIGARIAGNTGLVAPPSAVLYALVTQILPDHDVRAALLTAIYEITAAYVFAVSGGLSLGLAVGWTKFGRNSLFPIVMLFYAIPQVVLLPLFTLSFGIGAAAKIAFGCSHGVFPVIVNTIAGMRNVNPVYLQAARSMGANRADIICNVVFPHMTGSFFAGLRLAMTMTLLGVILAELYVSAGGIGFFTRQFANTFDPAPLFALIAALTMIAMTMNGMVRLAERRWNRWKAA
jgi:ABC-type nitrate/sulfonate/bicarbonate transport system permease component